jgi:hypothetical protein
MVLRLAGLVKFPRAAPLGLAVVRGPSPLWGEGVLRSGWGLIDSGEFACYHTATVGSTQRARPDHASPAPGVPWFHCSTNGIGGTPIRWSAHALAG